MILSGVPVSLYDLHFSPFAVAVITEGGQFIADAFEIATGDIVEIQFWLLLVVAGAEQLVFDARLILGQPVEIQVEVVFVERVQTQHITGGVRAAC